MRRLKLTSIALENFRSYKDRALFDNLKDTNIFVGPNKAGKSNVFEALSLLRALSGGNMYRSFKDLVFDKDVDKTIKIAIELMLSEKERKQVFALMQQSNGLFSGLDLKQNKIFEKLKYEMELDYQAMKQERFYTSDSDGKYVLLISHSVVQDRAPDQNYVNLQDYFARTKSIEGFGNIMSSGRQDWSRTNAILHPDKGFVEFKIAEMMRVFLRNIKVFPAVRVANAQMDFGEDIELSENVTNLVRVMNTLQTSKPKEFVRVIGVLSRLVEGIDDVTAPPVGGRVTAKMQEQGLTQEIDFANMSVGMQQILILVFAIERIRPEQTVCIEEPEIHLHATAQKRMFDLIRNKSHNNQIFITTHSSIITAIGDDVATYLITKSEGASKVTPIENKGHLNFIKEQLGIRNSDIYGNDYVLFVEGDSEFIAVPIVASALGYHQIGREVRLNNLNGSGEAKKLRNFLSYLKDFGTEAFIMVDGDKEVSTAIADYEREGLLKKGYHIIWEKEFEDNFESVLIIKIMRQLAQKKGFKFEMTVDELENQRKNGKVANILQKYMYESGQPDFNKKQFAEEIANEIAKEIYSISGMSETVFDKGVKSMMEALLK